MGKAKKTALRKKPKSVVADNVKTASSSSNTSKRKNAAEAPKSSSKKRKELDETSEVKAKVKTGKLDEEPLPRSNPLWKWDDPRFDTLLLEAIEECGRHWNVVADKINHEVGVTHRQCFERFRTLQRSGNTSEPTELWSEPRDRFWKKFVKNEGAKDWVKCSQYVNQWTGVTATQCSERSRVLKRRSEKEGRKDNKKKAGKARIKKDTSTIVKDPKVPENGENNKETKATEEKEDIGNDNLDGREPAQEGETYNNKDEINTPEEFPIPNAAGDNNSDRCESEDIRSIVAKSIFANASKNTISATKAIDIEKEEIPEEREDEQ